MENDINKILETKREWRKYERRVEERRKKYGTPEDRNTLDYVMRAGCPHCRIRLTLIERLHAWLIYFLPLIIVFFIVTPSFAYTASWYGTTGDTMDPWKHVRTADGERFNENALTAASWGFPMGSRVRVTNIATGVSIVVRINDRGPGRHLYRKGRIIDLTRGAFERIANLRDGVIKVDVKRIFKKEIIL